MAYLVGAGLVPEGVAWSWAVGSLVLLLRYPKKSLSMLLQVPVTFAPFYYAQKLAPEAFWEAAIWAFLMLLLDGRRFLGVVVGFMVDAGLLASARRESRP